MLEEVNSGNRIPRPECCHLTEEPVYDDPPEITITDTTIPPDQNSNSLKLTTARPQLNQPYYSEITRPIPNSSASGSDVTGPVSSSSPDAQLKASLLSELNQRMLNSSSDKSSSSLPDVVGDEGGDGEVEEEPLYDSVPDDLDRVSSESEEEGTAVNT